MEGTDQRKSFIRLVFKLQMLYFGRTLHSEYLETTLFAMGYFTSLDLKHCLQELRFWVGQLTRSMMWKLPRTLGLLCEECKELHSTDFLFGR